MTTTFELIEGAITTDLNDGTNTKMSKYTPATKDIGVETATETAVIMIDNADADTLDSVREGIIRRLFNAYQRNEGGEHQRDKTYISFQPEGASALWRSEIIGGRIKNERDAHGEAWGVNPVEFTIIWTRRNYWEGPEAQVPLTNTNGTDDTSGLNIYGVNDGSGSPPNDRVNYCDIKAADVDGDLPAATRLEITNSFAGNRLDMVWIGQNIIDPANHVWAYEGEDAAGGTPTVDAGSSGGDYNLVSVSSSPSFGDLLTWTIPAADVSAAKGGMMKAIIRFSSSTVNPKKIWWRFHMEVAGYTLWVSGRSKPDSNFAILLRDIAIFNFPPWLRGQTGQAEIDLVLEGQQETGAPVPSKIDTLYLIPAEGWRYIDARDRVENTERIIDDGIDGYLYIDDGAGADKRSACVGYGNPIYLEHGKLQRLYFLLHSEIADISEVARNISVKLYYRPRRYTV